MTREPEYEEGDRVRIDIPAYIVKTFSDGDALVDADGKEILVAGDEIVGRDEINGPAKE
jgi:hypothetical protein